MGVEDESDLFEGDPLTPSLVCAGGHEGDVGSSASIRALRATFVPVALRRRLLHRAMRSRRDIESIASRVRPASGLVGMSVNKPAAVLVPAPGARTGEGGAANSSSMSEVGPESVFLCENTRRAADLIGELKRGRGIVGANVGDKVWRKVWGESTRLKS